MKFGLKQTTIEKICAVFAHYPQVEQAVLYGSRAKGSYRTGSDIDLTLCGGADLTMDVLYRIINKLDDLLLPYTIDVSIFNNITDSDVVEYIQRVGVIFYDKTKDKISYSDEPVGDVRVIPDFLPSPSELAS